MSKRKPLKQYTVRATCFVRKVFTIEATSLEDAELRAEKLDGIVDERDEGMSDWNIESVEEDR